MPSLLPITRARICFSVDVQIWVGRRLVLQVRLLLNFWAKTPCLRPKVSGIAPRGRGGPASFFGFLRPARGFAIIRPCAGPRLHPISVHRLLLWPLLTLLFLPCWRIRDIISWVIIWFLLLVVIRHAPPADMPSFLLRSRAGRPRGRCSDYTRFSCPF